MSQFQTADTNAMDADRASPAYVPPLQRTAGQPLPIGCAAASC